MPHLAHSWPPEADTLWPGLAEKGWLGNFSFARPDAAFLDSFNHLALDRYAAKAQRYRRFSQYKVSNEWPVEPALERLPHRPFVQGAHYNSLSGGILREFEPLHADFDKTITPYIGQLFEALAASRVQDYHLDIHQYRVCADYDAPGLSVPEGAHRDGMECVAILVFKRHNITPASAEFSILEPDTRQTVIKTVVGENEGILLDDRRWLHDATPVVAAGPGQGFRDYVVININRWEERRYGPEHERAAQI